MIPPCARYVLLSSGFDARVSSVTAQPRFAASQAAARPPRPLPITRTSVRIASFIRKASSRFDLETQIHCRGGMRQRTARTPVYACFGEFPPVAKCDSTGSFRANLSRRAMLSHLLDALLSQPRPHLTDHHDAPILP